MLAVRGASQQIWMTNVRFGSKADIETRRFDVRFTPESGHRLSVSACPLCAKSGHQFGLECNGPGTLCVIMGRLHITPEVDAISFTPQARQVVVQAILAILLARVIAAILVGRRVTRR
jgi:hypothetical protein